MCQSNIVLSVSNPFDFNRVQDIKESVYLSNPKISSTVIKKVMNYDVKSFHQIVSGLDMRDILAPFKQAIDKAVIDVKTSFKF
jgi:hypothetical protein